VLGGVWADIDTPLILNPFNEYNADEMDLGRVWKYKLTGMGVAPWFFQNSGIEIFPIIFVYFLTIVLWVFRTAKKRKLKEMQKMGKVYFWVTRLRLV
jgi:hypothetical protein